MNELLTKLWREIVAFCVSDLGVTPTLYASNAVVLATAMQHPINDIDFLLPANTLSLKDKVISVFKSHGFQYMEAKVLTFVKEGIEIEIGAYEYWQTTCRFPDNYDVLIEDKVPYYRLSIRNLIALYSYLQTTDRITIKKQADLRKLDALNDALLRGIR